MNRWQAMAAYSLMLISILAVAAWLVNIYANYMAIIVIALERMSKP